jgi:hypothetical protein
MGNPRRWIWSGICWISLCLLLSGCCSSSGPEENGTPKEDPSFAQDIQPILSPGCTIGGCHDASASAGLDLRPGQSLQNLIDVRSVQEPNLTRIIPFDAQNSYLIIKLEGRQNQGSRMPLGGQALGATQIQNIRNWINRGARDN